ncbi:MAG TPA: RIP metalloprotease RseP [Acidobacteriaceae bacterium]|jgi:regulator of sigma E protease
MHILHVIVEFAIVLGIMVLVHEMGHFAVAKWCGVRVEAFSIGFGPRLFGFRIGDTDYRLSLLPLGGYVKMSGEVPGETPTGDPGEFNNHPRWQRTLIAFAGPFANFILSFVLMFFIGLYHHEVAVYLDGSAVVDYVPPGTAAEKTGLALGDTITEFDGQKNPSWSTVFTECQLHEKANVSFTFVHAGLSKTGSIPCQIDEDWITQDESLISVGLVPRLQPDPIRVDNVTGGTPADRAGLKAGDELVRIDGTELHSVLALQQYLHAHAGAPTVLTVLRGSQTVTLYVTPEKMATQKGGMDFRLGFSNAPLPTKIVRLSIPAAIRQSAIDNINDSTLVVRILKGMFTRQVSVKNMSGPVGIAQAIDIAAKNGHWTLVRLMSGISLQLGIFNLLPIPILDGGMILFLAIESIMRRDVSQQIKERVYQVAFVCLVLFATFIIFNDITKLPHGH